MTRYTLSKQHQKPFLRHPIFWTLFIVSSLGAGLFSYFYFSTALPFVDISITMNKAEALAKANSLAQKYAIGPTHAHEAAYFSSDSDTQNFIELERGGACAWKAFIQEKIYYPYVWLVRRFKEGDPNVAYFSFTRKASHMDLVNILPSQFLVRHLLRNRLVHEQKAF